MADRSATVFEVELGDGVPGNAYTFYEDGKIEFHYERNSIRFHKWIKPAEVDDATAQLLLEKCPYEFKGKLKGILKR